MKKEEEVKKKEEVKGEEEEVKEKEEEDNLSCTTLSATTDFPYLVEWC